MPGHRLLLTTVGTSDYEETQYVSGDREYTAITSAEALVGLQEFDSVLVAHTVEARETTDHLDRLQVTADEHGIEAERVEVPLIHDRDDIDTVLDRIVTAINTLGATEVVLDTSHAYRTLQMTFYTSVLQLSALDLVDIEGIYYAEQAGAGGVAPIVDLSYLATLVEWYHALRSFASAGTLYPVHDLLESKRNRVYRRGQEHSELVRLEKVVASVTSYLDSGLPLEMGAAAQETVSKIDELDDSDFIGPEGAFLDPLARRLDQFAIDQDVSPDEKEDIELTMSELERQRDVVQFYVANGKYWIALECARELFLNRVLFEQFGTEVEWLDTEVRIEGRKLLTERAGKRQADQSDDPPEVIKLWDRLSQYRNMHAHAGFDENRTPTGAGVREAIQTVCEKVTDDEFWRQIV